MTGAEPFPMFPLGTVLLPSMVLPLNVFEPRYRALVDDVLAAPVPEFGVALIERGSEVGGGDVRTGTACVARVVDVQRAPDGRAGLIAVGARRVRVLEWLPDDPYPRAVVEDWPDADEDVPEGDLDRLVVVARRVAALANELGGPALPPDLELATDAAVLTHQLALLAPIGPLDRQRVLEATGPAGRADLLADLLAEQEELLQARLHLGDD